MKTLVFLTLTLLGVAAVVVAQSSSLSPAIDGEYKQTSIVAVRLSGSQCSQEKRQASGCCSSPTAHLTSCCQNQMICSQGLTRAEANCDVAIRAVTCCKTPESTCCSQPCYIEPHIKEKDDAHVEITTCANRDTNACCAAGQSMCCKKCPLPYSLVEVNAEDTPTATAAPTVIPGVPATPGGVAAPPAALTPGCAPAACPAAKKMLPAKVDCSDWQRSRTCCNGPNDHLYSCCMKNDNPVCTAKRTKIGDMKMGTLCTAAIQASTCCTVANLKCCRQCSPNTVAALPPVACPAAVATSTCCSATRVSCCKTC